MVFAGWEAADGTSDTDKCQSFEGFDHYSMDEFRTEQKGVVLRVLGFLFRGHKTMSWIKNSDKFDLIIAYNPPAIFAARLQKYGQRNGVKTALDSTEWYQSTHLPGGRFGLAALENYFRMRVIYPRFQNIICISRFLSKYFAGRNIVQIPPLVSQKINHRRTRKPGKTINLVYAGSPGQKDDLLPVIRALPGLNKQGGIKTHLTVAGVDWSTLTRHLTENQLSPEAYKDFITCLGRIPKTDVAALYDKSDFSILFRQNQRYAIAGFPTKSVESWASGCPIICNRVGDISEIGRDNHEVLFITTEPGSAKATEMLIQKLMAVISEGRYGDMSADCQSLALQKFSPDGYHQALGKFLENTGAGKS